MNYVKFQKGSVEAFEALGRQGRVEENTLYFIYDKNNPNNGLLYLGNRLISGNNSQMLSMSLEDLSDVAYISPKQNSLLSYSNGLWTDVDFSYIIQLIRQDANLNNFITSVSEDFKVQEGKLNLNKINVSQVQNLQDLLDGKVPKQDGARLLTEEEAKKIEKLDNLALITGINEEYFKLNDGKLDLQDETSLSLKDVPILRKEVGNLEDLIDKKEDGTLIDEINQLKESLRWETI